MHNMGEQFPSYRFLYLSTMITNLQKMTNSMDAKTSLTAVLLMVFIIAGATFFVPNKDKDIQRRYQLTANGSVHYTELDTQDSITLTDFTIPKAWLTRFDSTYSDRNYKLVAREFVNQARTSYLFDKYTPYGNIAWPIMFLLAILPGILNYIQGNYDYEATREEQKRRIRNGIVKPIVIVCALWISFNVVAYCWIIDSSLVFAGKMLTQFL